MTRDGADVINIETTKPRLRLTSAYGEAETTSHAGVSGARGNRKRWTDQPLSATVFRPWFWSFVVARCFFAATGKVASNHWNMELLVCLQLRSTMSRRAWTKKE